MLKTKTIEKKESIVILQVNIEVQHIVYVILRFNVPNEIPVVFHNGSNYDYHFIIKKLVNEFEGQFDCLEENTEKYKTFFITTKKKLQILIR